MNPNGWITIGTKIDTTGIDKDKPKVKNKLKDISEEDIEFDFELGIEDYEAQIENLQFKLDELINTYNLIKETAPYEGQEKDLMELGDKISKLDNQLIKLKQKQEDLTKKDFSAIKSSVEGISNSINGIVKKVTRWGLALFGVRSAYSFILKSMNQVRQYDEQLDTNLKYMQYALANTLKPLIEYLVNLAMQLMNYVAYIVNAWFGINIFEKSGIADYEKAMKKSSDSAKEINKQLTAFDEANVLNNTSSGTSASSTTPSMDFSKINNDVPKWVQWIADNKKLILEIVAGVTSAILLAKGADLIRSLSSIFNITKKIGGASGVGGINLGLLAVVGSLATIVWSVNEWKKAMKETAKEVENINKTGYQTGKKWAEQQTDINELQRELNNKQMQYNDLKKENEKITTKITGASSQYNKTLYNNLLVQNEMVQAQVRLWREGKLTAEQEEQLKKLLKEQKNYLEDQEVYLYNRKVDTTELVKISKNYKEVLQEMTNETKKLNNVKLNDKTIKITFDKSELVKMLKNLPNQLNLGFGFTISTTPIKKAFGLARGGIINVPGQGISLGNNLRGGEAGPEAILPLDDTTLNRLGSAIARNMVVSLTNINQMNARTISREVKKIQIQDDFASNI